jgi:hypothetical protein
VPVEVRLAVVEAVSEALTVNDSEAVLVAVGSLDGDWEVVSSIDSV